MCVQIQNIPNHLCVGEQDTDGKGEKSLCSERRHKYKAANEDRSGWQTQSCRIFMHEKHESHSTCEFLSHLSHKLRMWRSFFPLNAIVSLAIVRIFVGFAEAWVTIKFPFSDFIFSTRPAVNSKVRLQLYVPLSIHRGSEPNRICMTKCAHITSLFRLFF